MLNVLYVQIVILHLLVSLHLLLALHHINKYFCHESDHDSHLEPTTWSLVASHEAEEAQGKYAKE